MDTIRVKVKQAHESRRADGRFKRYEVGEIIEELPKNEFAPNIHKRILDVKDKEDKEDDTRKKKR